MVDQERSVEFLSQEDLPEISMNLNVRGMPLSATLHINERSNDLIRQGRQVYKFGLGQSPFPVPQPVEKTLKDNAHQKDYLPVAGLPELRESVCGYLLRTQELEFLPDNIIIGPGTKELMFILQLVYYGDLIVPNPSWVSYAPQARIVGRRVRWVPTRRENLWKLDPKDLEALCKEDPGRPRLLILNYPNNPHGYTYDATELEEIARVARNYRILVLADEIYGGLHHEGNHVSLARFYPEGTIVSDGLSKWCGAGGWRLGAFAFPETLSWLRDGMKTVASETFTSVSAPIQYAAVRAFEAGEEIEQYLLHSRRILSALGRFVAGRLRETGAYVPDPEGAFYLFPDFGELTEKLQYRGLDTSKRLCETVLDETGVAILPGSAFGRPAEELTVRLSYVDFDGEKALKAAEQLPISQPLETGFLETYCPNCVAATRALCEWLEAD